ncbi:MAG: cob(I)yrinic acid a,c-diamide adenosyltransferase [Spirosomataceae bacterium]
MKIYTKTGDKGSTSLVGGTRVSKSHEKIEAYGTVDELNAWIGVLRDNSSLDASVSWQFIQDRLFTIGSLLASEPEQTKKQVPDLRESDIALLETWMDAMQLPPLRAFVLPGGHLPSSFAHVARTVCRRAERMVIRLEQSEEIHPLIIPYLNRLSDYLFMISRQWIVQEGIEEITWKPRLD